MADDNHQPSEEEDHPDAKACGSHASARAVGEMLRRGRKTRGSGAPAPKGSETRRRTGQCFSYSEIASP